MAYYQPPKDRDAATDEARPIGRFVPLLASRRELERALEAQRAAEDFADALTSSTFWRITGPVRKLLDWLRGRRPAGGRA